MLRILRFFVLTLVFAVLPRLARAAPPPPELMARLAAYAARFEQVRKRASFAVEGHMDTIDRDGKVGGVKKVKGRMESDGKRGHFLVVEYTEDGEDKTEKERKEARENDAKPQEERDKKRLDSPLLESQQANYVFDVVETDKADPTRVRITFVPKEPSEHTIEGSAWVDTVRGTPISAGFKLSKPGAFVDYVHVTVEFGADTELGPSVSKMTMDGKGGFLFLREHFRGEATISDYRIVPPAS